MSDVGGSYDCVTKSPMGDQTSVLTVVPGDDGKTFTGTNKGQMGELDVKNGTIDGNTLAWKMDMVVPMPMELNGTATVDGDQLNGTVNAGAFGDMAMTGTRKA